MRPGDGDSIKLPEVARLAGRTVRRCREQGKGAGRRNRQKRTKTADSSGVAGRGRKSGRGKMNLAGKGRC